MWICIYIITIFLNPQLWLWMNDEFFLQKNITPKKQKNPNKKTNNDHRHSSTLPFPPLLFKEEIIPSRAFHDKARRRREKTTFIPYIRVFLVFKFLSYNKSLSQVSTYRSKDDFSTDLHVFRPYATCSPIKSRPTSKKDIPWKSKKWKWIPCADRRLLAEAVSRRNARASSFV